MTRDQITREALEQIAERGITRGSIISFTCGVCRREQKFQGPCCNRDCTTRIARDALDGLRSLGPLTDYTSRGDASRHGHG